LYASARTPGGCLGISCIHQPKLNCASTIAATTQCSAMATRV
jgi:hypothetical protein